MESNVVDRPQDISFRLVKKLQDHTEYLREELRNKLFIRTIIEAQGQVYNLQQKLSDLHRAQSNSYNSIDNNDFMNKGDGNNNESNKNQSCSEFHDNRRFNKSFYTEVLIDDVINPYSEPTKELVISSHKNMNNDNNSKSVENNIVESDIDTTEIIVDDTNKITHTEKRIKKIKQRN